MMGAPVKVLSIAALLLSLTKCGCIAMITPSELPLMSTHTSSGSDFGDLLGDNQDPLGAGNDLLFAPSGSLNDASISTNNKNSILEAEPLLETPIPKQAMALKNPNGNDPLLLLNIPDTPSLANLSPDLSNALSNSGLGSGIAALGNSQALNDEFGFSDKEPCLSKPPTYRPTSPPQHKPCPHEPHRPHQHRPRPPLQPQQPSHPLPPIPSPPPTVSPSPTPCLGKKKSPILPQQQQQHLNNTQQDSESLFSNLGQRQNGGDLCEQIISEIESDVEDLQIDLDRLAEQLRGRVSQSQLIRLRPVFKASSQALKAVQAAIYQENNTAILRASVIVRQSVGALARQLASRKLTSDLLRLTNNLRLLKKNC